MTKGILLFLVMILGYLAGFVDGVRWERRRGTTEPQTGSDDGSA